MDIQHEIQSINKEVKHLSADVTKILNALIGDEKLGQQGLVNKVASHEDWIQKQKLQMAKMLGIAIGSGFFGGIVMEIISKIFE